MIVYEFTTMDELRLWDTEKREIKIMIGGHELQAAVTRFEFVGLLTSRRDYNAQAETIGDTPLPPLIDLGT